MIARQRLVLLLAAVAIVATLLFPPFHLRGDGGVVVNLGYSVLWSPPGYEGSATVDEAMLLVEWIGILLVAVLALGSIRMSAARRLASPPDPAELKALLTHVASEWVAVEACAQRLESSSGRDAAALEALLLHARQVRDFLNRRWRPSDRYADSELVAEHYFPEPHQWRRARPRMAPALWTTKAAIDLQLAHLSRLRANPTAVQDLQARIPEVLAALRLQWHAFESSLPEPYRSGLKAAITERRANG